MTPVTLVFQAVADIPALSVLQGDFVVCEPGAVPPEADLLVVHLVPRGRLGALMGAVNDDRLRLCDPAVTSVSPAALLAQQLRPV